MATRTHEKLFVFYTILFTLCVCAPNADAQSYHAVSGSPYAGVTSMYNNPASTVNQAFGWDVTLFSLQSTLANTSFVLKNNSLPNIPNFNAPPTLLSPGLRGRYLENNVDFNLLNARFKLNPKSAFAIGFRLRSYNHAEGQPFFYNDTISTLKSFLHENDGLNYYDGYITHSAWAELNLNYSRIILQNETSYLSAGITVRYLRSLSGGFADLSQINFLEKQKNGGYYYVLNQGAATVEYSGNYEIPGNSSGAQSAKSFIQNTASSAAVDIGAEYLLKNGDDADDAPVNTTNYVWKIGASIMDIGRNKFNPINGSFYVNNPKKNITDSILNNQINGVRNIRALRDTVAHFFKTADSLHNSFAISLPTRLVISVDRYFGSHFFINGELTLSFYSTRPASALPGATLHTREINLLAITPRWETASFGLYLPVQYNTQGQVWVGGAIKLGPLLLGVHSLDFFKWFVRGTQNYTGGGYILLSLHPFEHRQKEMDLLDCPRM